MQEAAAAEAARADAASQVDDLAGANDILEDENTRLEAAELTLQDAVESLERQLADAKTQAENAGGGGARGLSQTLSQTLNNEGDLAGLAEMQRALDEARAHVAQLSESNDRLATQLAEVRMPV